MLTRVVDKPHAHIQCQIHHKYHCVEYFKYIYFSGNYFLNMVEYTGNLQGNNAFKTLLFFFFKGRIGIFIMFCFSK